MTISLEGKPYYVLNATCDSRMGTVAAVSGFLASRQCYITDMQQFDDILSGRFFVRVSFFGDPEKTPNLDSLREQVFLGKSAKSLIPKKRPIAIADKTSPISASRTIKSIFIRPYTVMRPDVWMDEGTTASTTGIETSVFTTRTAVTAGISGNPMPLKRWSSDLHGPIRTL